MNMPQCYVMLCYIINLIELCGKLKIFPNFRKYMWHTEKFFPLNMLLFFVSLFF
jgi:hypothetical protein